MTTIMIGDTVWDGDSSQWTDEEPCIGAYAIRDIDAGLSTPFVLTSTDSAFDLPAQPWESWTFGSFAPDAGCNPARGILNNRALATYRVERENPLSNPYTPPADEYFSWNAFDGPATWAWTWDVAMEDIFSFSYEGAAGMTPGSDNFNAEFAVLLGSLSFTFLGATETIDAPPSGWDFSIGGNEHGGLLCTLQTVAFSVAWNADAQRATLTYTISAGDDAFTDHIQNYTIALEGPFDTPPAGTSFPLSIAAFFQSDGPFEAQERIIIGRGVEGPALTAYVAPTLALVGAGDATDAPADHCGRITQASWNPAGA